MKITFLMPTFESFSGGIRVIMIYAQKLQARGHEIRLVCMRRRQPPLVRRLWNTVSGKAVKRGANEAFRPDGMSVTMVDAGRPMRDEDVPDGDVVVATWWETAPWAAALSPRKGAKAYFMQDYGSSNQPLEPLIATWRLPLHMITISPWLKRVVNEHVERDVDLAPNAVDHELFYSAPREKPARPTVGFVYSHNPAKGVDICVRAAEIARKELPELRVVAFGGAVRPERVPVADFVEFHVRPTDEELRSIYSSCTAWLFGSRREGFGLPILEALACRTPVIATPAGVAEDFIKPEFGVLVGAEDSGGMAEAIVRMCRLTPDQWRAMSEAGHEAVAGYTWDDAAQLFEEALFRAAGISSSAPAR